MAHVRYSAQHLRDVRLWPRFFEHQTGIEAKNLEVICHNIFNENMDTLRGSQDLVKRLQKVADVFGRGRYFLFVLLGPAVCGSVASLKKISATASTSGGSVAADHIADKI